MISKPHQETLECGRTSKLGSQNLEILPRAKRGRIVTATPASRTQFP
jgi:hypothetical protein